MWKKSSMEKRVTSIYLFPWTKWKNRTFCPLDEAPCTFWRNRQVFKFNLNQYYNLWLWDHSFHSLYLRTLWSRACKTDYNMYFICFALDKVKRKTLETQKLVDPKFLNMDATRFLSLYLIEKKRKYLRCGFVGWVFERWN